MLRLDVQNNELNLLRYAINNSEEEIVVCSIDGTILFANETMINNHKLAPDYAGVTIFDLSIIELTKKIWGDSISTLKSQGGEIRSILTKKIDRQTNAYYISRMSLNAIGGKEIVWIFATDTTNKILQEKKIKELNYIMDAILNNIPVYLFVKDTSKDFRYIYWNKAFEHFSKITADSAIGKTDYEIFPNRADAEKFRKDDLSLLHKGNHIEFEEEYIDNTGTTRCVHTLKALIHNDTSDLPWIIGVSWDITDLKQTEKELTVAKIKAEQSDRLKSAFLANMSHEIRTPLNAIVGFSRILCENADAENKQYLDIIEDNTNLLIQLINDILDISKIEAGTLEFIDNIIDLDSMFIDIYEMNRHRVGEKVMLVHEKSNKHISIKCDRNRLLQVITNFLNNAIKFTPSGEIKFGYKVTKTDIDFFVQDTGIGISKKNKDEVFNRFTKLNNFIQGTGLGLSICKTIADKMGGKIWVDSKEDIGSTFYFSIPYNEYYIESENKCHDKHLEKAQPCGTIKKKILIAEDIYSNYLLVSNLLCSEYELQHSVDGEDTLIKFKEFNPDLILMDIKMPNKDGLEVTRIIRESSSIPIIALTSYAYDTDRKSAYEVGCNDFITKPVSKGILHRVLQKYL